MIRRLVLMAMVVLLAAACASTDPNEVKLVYNGGPFEGRGFDKIIGPNSQNVKVGVAGDKSYTYRIDQRSWIGRSNEDGKVSRGADRAAIEFVSRDGIRMRAPFELYFTLNQDPKILKRFHEEIGLKTNAHEGGDTVEGRDDLDEGWVRMLHEYFDPQLERAIDSAGLAHEWRPLREDEDVRRTFARVAAQRFTENLADIVGGNYFCNQAYQSTEDSCGEITVTIGQPTPVDPALVRAIESEQVLNAQTQALSAEEARAQAEARGRQPLIDQLGPDLYVCLQAIDAAREAKVAPPPCLSGINPVPVTPVG